MNKNGIDDGLQQVLKRILDIVVVVTGMLLLWPLFVFIAIAIKLNSKGPVVYRHQRIGKDGAPFDLYKFRSMVSGGDDTSYIRYLGELIESEQNGQSHALPYRKLEGDPRVTKVGYYLRTFYLDELPQLWNILKGDMSLVGPRPHVRFEVDHYTPEQGRRLTARPGATGLWQVTGKADSSFSELIELDLQYIDEWSLWLDLKIIFKTVALVFKGGEGFWARMAKRIPGKPPASEMQEEAGKVTRVISASAHQETDSGEAVSPADSFRVKGQIDVST